MRDMREILLMAKEDGPAPRNSVDDIVAAGRRRRRRAVTQRLGGAGIVAAAMATAGVLVAVNLAVPNHQGFSSVLPAASPPAPTAPAQSPPFTFTFGGYQVDDYRVLAPDQVTPVYQTTTVLRDNKDVSSKEKEPLLYAGTLTVYQPKMFNPEQFRSGAKLTVQGRDAYQADFQRSMISSGIAVTVDQWNASSGTGTVTVTALAWQYAPDSWAVLDSQETAFPAADKVKVAERFTVFAGDPVPAKVPFRTGYLPAGFTLQSVSGQSMTADWSAFASYVYAKPQPSTAPLAGPRDLTHDSKVTSVVISVLWVDAPPPDAIKRTSRCNAGQHWCMRTLPGNEFYVAIEDPSKTLSDDELLKVADGLTFASLKDAATWYPIS